MTLQEAFKKIQQDDTLKVKEVINQLGISKAYFYRIIDGFDNVKDLTREALKQRLKDKYGIIVDDDGESE